jgi:hypothetical protein
MMGAADEEVNFARHLTLTRQEHAMPIKCVHRDASRAYRSYCKAKARCENPDNPRYYAYGGRGIRFLLPPFPEFYAAMGERPLGFEFDRIDPEGHYELSNVRWILRYTGKQRPYKSK